jgi:hypothetical protein
MAASTPTPSAAPLTKRQRREARPLAARPLQARLLSGARLHPAGAVALPRPAASTAWDKPNRRPQRFTANTARCTVKPP